MAYSTKYYHNYCDSNNLSCKIEILQRDYVGVTTEVEGQDIPIIIDYESSEDFKFSPIRPSSAEVLMTFGTGNDVDFEEFWTADEREFQVKHYIDSNLDWIGFVIPNGFSYELRGGKYYAAIQASDGLSTLKSIDFKDDITGLPYGTQDLDYNNGFEYPFILIATEILRKLDLNISVWSCIDSYEKSMTKTGDTRESDPLATSYVNVKTYINDTNRRDIPYWKDVGEVWDSEEVLVNLCRIFGAKVYQEKGVWKIKSINADIDYGSGDTQRYWHKYNTLAVYLGREPINSIQNITCDTMIGNDHTMAMGDVYKAFRMNYEYQFVRDGDSPVNLLQNGNFYDFDNIYTYSAPNYWSRYGILPYWKPPKLKSVDVDEIGVPFNKAIQFGIQEPALDDDSTSQTARYGNGLLYKELIPVNKGDKITFSHWDKLKPSRDDDEVGYLCLFRITLEIPATDENPSRTLYLGNGNTAENGVKDYQWSEEECFFLNTFNFIDYDYSGFEKYEYKWRKYLIELEIPENANLTFMIKGLTATTGSWDNKSYKPLLTYVGTSGYNTKLTRSRGKVIKGNWIDKGGYIPRLQIGNVSLGVIPSTSEVAKTQDYIYTNENPYYSYVPDPITIYNGDIQDVRHLSNIIVPSNISGQKNFWNTIDDKYENSSLGLLTVKSIMNQYYKPFRIFEGTIKGVNLNFSDVYTFDILPGKRFIMQRGKFNKKKNYVESATLMELLTDVLPNGGTEGGNNTDPNWQPTGNTRCRKAGFLNSGFVEYEEQDVNSNSESYEQTRWQLAGYDDTACPLGEPDGFYWGAKPLDYNTSLGGFQSYPIIAYNTAEFPNTVVVEYDNAGDLALYFIHLDALGVVEEITTSVQGNIISDWQYLDDVTYNGYLYNVLRTNYTLADFTELEVRFKFNS